MPALLRAQRVQAKAARVKFDWPDAQAAWSKVEEEMRRNGEAIVSGDTLRIGEELGDALFSLVNVARLAKLDAEDVLNGAIEKFRGASAAWKPSWWRAERRSRGNARRVRAGLGGCEKPASAARSSHETPARTPRPSPSSVATSPIGRSTPSSNAANSTLAMGTGVAGAIKRKGGVINRGRGDPAGTGRSRRGGADHRRQPPRNSHHPRSGHGALDLKTDAEKIAATTRAVLALAAKHRITSLALPALGTGVGHVPAAVSANAMLNAVVGPPEGESNRA